jgi:phosphoribosylaminoimidazole-succinocarboxamide synthase
MKLLYEGKAKRLYEGSDRETLVMEFLDRATAFDGKKMAEPEGKGRLNTKISKILFELLKGEGIKTHYIKKIDEKRILVKKLRMFPLEVVVRNKATGSIVRRLGVEKGKLFSPPLLEFFLKDDSLGDPLICEGHIFSLGIATPSEIEHIKSESLKVNEILRKFFEKRGLYLVDMKLEFGKDSDGNILLGDEITPDTMRLWDVKTGESYDKDVFREDKGDIIPVYESLLKRMELE